MRSLSKEQLLKVELPKEKSLPSHGDRGLGR